jgi:hypothetical protein
MKDALRTLRDIHGDDVVPHILYMIENCPAMKLDEVKNVFKIPDIVLTGTHSRCDTLTEFLKGDANHYLVMKHGFGDPFRKLTDPSVRLHGEILTEPTEHTKLRNAFTIHSFQGDTVIEPTKLFIDIHNIRHPADIYTAASRIQNWDQIILIS